MNLFINTNITNKTNQKIYYSKINEDIENIFKYSNKVYNKKVKIITKKETVVKNIIAKTKNSLIDEYNEIIPFDIINKIEEIE